MSDSGHDREYNEEFEIVARPYFRARIAAAPGDGGLRAWSVALDYDAAGIAGLPGTADPSRAGIEWRGVEFDVYRNGERLLGEGGDLDLSDVLGYVDDLAVALSRLSRRLR
jgi:hypothetical protein